VGGTSDDSTATLSRDHDVSISRSGLVTIAGGKWTTYRRMAEHRHAERFGALARYGSDAIELRALIERDPALAARLHPEHDYVLGEVVWAAREEMARTVGDVLARRTRLLLLDHGCCCSTQPAASRPRLLWQRVSLRSSAGTMPGSLPRSRNTRAAPAVIA